MLIRFLLVAIILVGSITPAAAFRFGTVQSPTPGTIRVLAQSAAPVALTGTVNETTLATYTLPGGTMGPNGAIRVTAIVSNTNSSNAKTLRFKLGTAQWTLATITTTASEVEQRTIRNRGTANSQVSHVGGVSGSYGASSGSPTTSTVDTSTDQTITITGQLASSGETLTLEGYTIELLPGVP